MERMAESIMKVAVTLPEGVPLAAKGLLHLGSRAAVDQTLSRLAARGELIRAGRGIYMRPVQTRFGPRSPSTEQAIEALAGPAPVLFRSRAHVRRPFVRRPLVISSRGLNVSGAGCRSR